MTRLRNFRNNSGLNNGVLLSSCTSSYELSSNLNDSVTSTTLSSNSSTVFVNELYKRCYSFTGGLYSSENWITLQPLTLSNNMSASIWVKPTNFQNYTRIWEYGNFRLNIRSSNSLIFNDFMIISVSGGLSSWTHICVTINGLDVFVYINGIFIKSGTMSSILTNTVTTCYLGHSLSSTDSNYVGFMKQFKLFNITLSADQVTMVYNQ